MKKMNFSLIIKITGIVFIAFAAVLGNEIRLGIDRYIKNTLETDAEATIRNLDRFSKSYIETIAVNKVDLSSQKFKNLYNISLSGDNTKIKCLVNSQGKIIDLSREGVGDPNICFILNDYYGSQSWPAYIDLSSIDTSHLDKIEDYLKTYQNENVTLTLTAKFGQEHAQDKSVFDDVQIKELKLDDTVLYEGKVKGETETLQGVVSTYTSYNVEVVYSSPTTESLKSSQSDIVKEKKKTPTLVLDYRNSMNGLQYQIQKNFKQFKDSGKAFKSTGTEYADYYLLTPYEYNGKYYSTVMMRLEDWSLLTNSSEQIIDFSDEKNLDEFTVGYVFVTQEYNDIMIKSLRQFIVDNSSTYFLAFLLIVLICLSMAYMIIKPIRRIETTAKHIARREFDYPIDMTRHDELGDLARSIDTMSKELEKTINNLHQEIERVTELEGVRKDFVSNFTHEIKTPLGIINGFSELVELEKDDKKRNEYISIIQNETKRINELVLAMLDLSKLESQNISLTIEEVDLLDIVDECLDSMMFLFDKKNILLETHLDASVIQADRFKIEMVINNFISNALRYTEEGNKIIIHLDEHCFEIENEGAHIPESDIHKIWLTFHKVDKSRNEQGTGLGLAICKAVLDLHQFEYGVKNTEKGVLFYFKF